jgi:hypothetical protein
MHIRIVIHLLRWRQGDRRFHRKFHRGPESRIELVIYNVDDRPTVFQIPCKLAENYGKRSPPVRIQTYEEK